ncbi:hypothetical protein [Nocardiopsis composta]|uniref:Uncharacterized protein n=1 Tax=Nocardiopsis composta TaxID=157465 RepID=A0A7W8VGJ7_9ACTN|nr:hypothetical protein [Nocardiopsis composta]MBB5435567.1 hypothetical protein [Nocardiopsis composta]
MKGVPWEETKRKVREADPGWDSPERTAEREAGREQLRAEIADGFSSRTLTRPRYSATSS